MGDVLIVNSTISGNTTNSHAGGIDQWGDTTDIINSTVAGNTPDSIYDSYGGPTTLVNTIVADNNGVDCQYTVSWSSLGHNLDSDGTCSLNNPTDLPNTDPMLGPPQNNGGQTFTHALLAGSPAIDAGDDSAAPATDQRGVSRPSGVQSDIGAYEVEEVTPKPPGQQSYVYPVKFVCGSITEPSDGMAGNEPPVKPGNYATAINIQNVFPETATLRYRASVARAVDPNVTTGPVSPPASAELEQYQAMEIDCPQIAGLLGGTEFAQAQFLKGFVAIESDVDLQVVAVYTAGTTGDGAAAGCSTDYVVLNTGYDQQTGLSILDGLPDDEWNMVSAPPPVLLGNSLVVEAYPPYLTLPLPCSTVWASHPDG